MSKSNQTDDIQIFSEESVTSTCDSKSLIDVSSNSPVSPIPQCNIVNKLNDHCLIKIFQYLPLVDLCSVAEVCITFQSNAVFVFERNFSIFNVNALIENFQWDHHFGVKCDDEAIHLVEKVFRNFGIYIQCIFLQQKNEKESDQILEFMATFCSKKNAKLTKLIMNQITIPARLVQSLQPLFARLKCLNIDGGSYDFRHKSLFSVCIELNEMILMDVNFGNCFNHQYKSLEKMFVVDLDDISDGVFNDFVAMNPQLKSLTVTTSYKIPPTTEIIQYYQDSDEDMDNEED